MKIIFIASDFGSIAKKKFKRNFNYLWCKTVCGKYQAMEKKIYIYIYIFDRQKLSWDLIFPTVIFFPW